MPKKVMTTPGTALNNALMDFLWNTGHVSIMWRQNSRVMRLNGHLYKFGYAGQGDICGMLKNGIHFQFEGKAGDDVATPKQIDNAAQIDRDGGLAAIVHSVDELRSYLFSKGYAV